MHYRCILSIGKVSDRSDHFCLQNSEFLDRGSNRKLLTFRFEFRSEIPKIEVFEFGNSLRVVRSTSYCTHMRNWPVLSIAKVSARSKHFCLQKSGFLAWGNNRKPFTFKINASLGVKFRKSRFSRLEGKLKLSDRPHIVPTCAAGQYYRLWKFQADRSIFAYKKLGFCTLPEIHEETLPMLPNTTQNLQNPVFGQIELGDRLGVVELASIGSFSSCISARVQNPSFL